MKREKFTNPVDPYKDMSHSEIAAQMGMTKQSVQQIEVKAMKTFRKRFIRLYPDTPKLFMDDLRIGRW